MSTSFLDSLYCSTFTMSLVYRATSDELKCTGSLVSTLKLWLPIGFSLSRIHTSHQVFNSHRAQLFTGPLGHSKSIMLHHHQAQLHYQIVLPPLDPSSFTGSFLHEANVSLGHCLHGSITFTRPLSSSGHQSHQSPFFHRFIHPITCLVLQHYCR